MPKLRSRFSHPQDDDSGERILQKLAGRCGKSRRILREYTENRWKWEQYSYRKIFGFFSTDFRLVPARKYRKIVGIDQKKSENFPMGIPLPCSSAFPHIPAETSPGFFIWVVRC
jgi:hypothetical protein